MLQLTVIDDAIREGSNPGHSNSGDSQSRAKHSLIQTVRPYGYKLEKRKRRLIAECGGECPNSLHGIAAHTGLDVVFAQLPLGVANMQDARWPTLLARAVLRSWETGWTSLSNGASRVIGSPRNHL